MYPGLNQVTISVSCAVFNIIIYVVIHWLIIFTITTLYNILIVCYVLLASTTITTKKVVKQPKDVAVKKEVLTTKSSKPVNTVSYTVTQCASSTATSITSTTSQVILTIPTLPINKLTLPVNKLTPPAPIVTKNTAPIVTKNTVPLPFVTKTTIPPPRVTTSTAPMPLVTKNIVPPPPVAAKHTTAMPPVTKYTPATATTKYTTLTVGSVLQARPIMASSANLVVSNKAMQGQVVMNIANAQLGKMLAMSHPIMQLTTGEGSQIHSSTVTMTLPPQPILPSLATTLVNQKHSESLSQWRPSPSSSVHGNLGLISTAANTVMKTSEMNTSSSNNNHQVLQEHSYQRAENVKSTVSNSLPLSANDEVLPQLFISPMNSPFK